jgi:hypothetical protein
MNEWNGWQIPHVGVAAAVENENVRSRTDIPIVRKSDMRISNFGSLFIGARMSDDYTRTELTFQNKDEYSDWKLVATDDGAGGLVGLRGTSVDNNPYVWGSTVKKVRDDQFFRMDMDNNVDGVGIDKPKFDVMDTNVVSADGMDQYKNYPTEGFRSFGGKYDFLPYTGVFGK